AAFSPGIRQDGAPFPRSGGVGVNVARSQAQAVATDAPGNVGIAGFTSGSLAGVPGDFNEQSGAAFVAKYSAGGTLLWARLVLDERNIFGVTEGAYGVATDPSGNIYVAGDTLNALPGETAVGGTDVFVAKFDAHGTAFAAGPTSGQLSLQPPLAGTSNYHIAKYDTDGNRLWLLQDRFGGPAFEAFNEAHGVAVDGAGNAYLAGHTTSQTGGTGGFLLEFGGTGTRKWESRLASVAPNAGLPVTSDGVAVSV